MHFPCIRAILIRTATIGYAREPDFEVKPPHAPTMEERIAWALLYRKVFREACDKEGVDLRAARRIVESFERKEAYRRRKEREREEKKVKSKL